MYHCYSHHHHAVTQEEEEEKEEQKKEEEEEKEKEDKMDENVPLKATDDVQIQVVAALEEERSGFDEYSYGPICCIIL